MAMAASLVFARKHLADFLEKQGMPYMEWNDFHDVRQVLERHWA
jgi:2-hydroxy-3-keto-5-methylthiopentenyl-1-phosphate phosphatase